MPFPWLPVSRSPRLGRSPGRFRGSRTVSVLRDARRAAIRGSRGRGSPRYPGAGPSGRRVPVRFRGSLTAPGFRPLLYRDIAPRILSAISLTEDESRRADLAKTGIVEKSPSARPGTVGPPRRAPATRAKYSRSPRAGMRPTRTPEGRVVRAPKGGRSTVGAEARPSPSSGLARGEGRSKRPSGEASRDRKLRSLESSPRGSVAVIRMCDSARVRATYRSRLSSAPSMAARRSFAIS